MEKGDTVYTFWMTDSFVGDRFGFWVDAYEVFDPAPAGSTMILLKAPGRDHITSRAPSEVFASKELAHAAAVAILRERIAKIQAQIDTITAEHLTPAEAVA
jgi:hypothetical protein